MFIKAFVGSVAMVMSVSVEVFQGQKREKAALCGCGLLENFS
jgi:hypothetical protein